MSDIFKNIALILFIIPGYGQVDTIELLKPTGNHSVSTVTYEWVDASREMQIRPKDFKKRSIITQFWYPSEVDANSIKAPYNALSSDYRNTRTNSYLRKPFAKDIATTPLIIIVPGRGTERFLYTTIAEELASNGFIVASVDLPEIGYVLYQDGFILKPSAEFKTPRGMMAGPYEKVDAFFEKPTEMGYHDLLFVLNKIEELNNIDEDYGFRNKIEMDNLGIFGHSLGGRIAGEFTARNEGIKVLATMEGIPPRDVRYEGKISVPSLMLCGSETLKYAVDNYNSFIENRGAVVYMAELLDFGHNSLTDNPYIHPSSFNYNVDASKGLKLGRRILTDFFNEHLKGQKGFYEKNNDHESLNLVVHQ